MSKKCLILLQLRKKRLFLNLPCHFVIQRLCHFLSYVNRLGSESLQGNINCAILGSGIGGSEDPRRKWERESVQRDAFVWKMIYNNRGNARSVYIAFQKALFTAFIAFMKKTENMLKEEIILNEVRFGGSPPINGTLRARRPCVQPWQGRYWTSKLKWLDLQTCGRSWQKSYYRLLNLRLEFFLVENIINIKH